MLDDRKRAELEQSVEAIGEITPTMLANLYTRLQDREEFTKAEAWEIVRITAFALANGKGMLQ